MTAEIATLARISRDYGIQERWTSARLAGFRVVVNGGRHDRVVRESNRTDLERGTVYWQTRNWLERQGLIASSWSEGGIVLTLTPVGRRVAIAAGYL